MVEFDSAGRAISIEEKPPQPRSNWAVTGLYFYDERSIAVSRRSLKPSPRGELEITDLNRVLSGTSANCKVARLGRGFAWLDTGTPEALIEAGEYVRAIEQRQGQRVACLEEIAFRAGWIDFEQARAAASKLSKSGYGQYISQVLAEIERELSPLDKSGEATARRSSEATA